MVEWRAVWMVAVAMARVEVGGDKVVILAEALVVVARVAEWEGVDWAAPMAKGAMVGAKAVVN